MTVTLLQGTYTPYTHAHAGRTPRDATDQRPALPARSLRYFLRLGKRQRMLPSLPLAADPKALALRRKAQWTTTGARSIKGVETPRKVETTEEQGGWRWRALEQPDRQTIGHLRETGSARSSSRRCSHGEHGEAERVEFPRACVLARTVLGAKIMTSTSTLWVFGLCVAALLVPPLGLAQITATPGTPNTVGPIPTVDTTFPLSFEKNQGQSEAAVQFLARGAGYTVFLTATEAVLTLRQPPEADVRQPPAPRLLSTAKSQRSTIRIQLVGGNQHSRVSGEGELPGRVNHLHGDNPQHWRTNIPTYAQVRYDAVYPGIDLLYYGTAHHLESDFVVAPGANPSVIRLAFTVLGEAQGHPSLTIAATGALVLTTSRGEVHMQLPQIYQEIRGKRQRVSGHYVLYDREGGDPTYPLPEIGFAIAAYDPAHPLVIDPICIYATYLGGKSNERAWGMAVDAAGSAYVTGEVVSPDFPTKQPLQPTFGGGDEDVFVTKLNPTGTAVAYSTYLGGSGADIGIGIAVDPAGNVS
jgi:hypothetical protein